MPDDLSAARRAERTRARWTTYLLLTCLALDAVAIAAGLSQRALLARLAVGVQLHPGDVAANDARHRLVGLLKLAALLGTGIVWLAWLHRAYGNLGLVGSKRSRFPQGWAVGYWLIPFVNLVRAYQTMKDLWLRSESLNDRDGYDNLPAPAFLAGPGQLYRPRAARQRRRNRRGAARDQGRAGNRPSPAALLRPDGRHSTEILNAELSPLRNGDAVARSV